MNTNLFRLLPPILLAATAAAQNPGYLFTTSQNEQTLSSSGGTVLQFLRPNDVACVEFAPCPVISAEKWAPITAYNTMAGDDDNNGMYWNPTMFGSIDALCDMPSPVACSTARTVFWSPSVAMGTNISGGPGLRPGDTGRIIRNGSGDGQVEYFLRAEDVQLALGMSTSSAVVDVDAICADPGYGVFFSLDQSHTVNAQCGITQLLDGDIWMIDAASITWSSNMTVAAVVPGSAFRVYSEAQMDAMVANAGITDRFGNCITQIIDVEALDFDWSGPIVAVPGCTGTAYLVPTLIFAGESMTGCGLCTTDLGGQIFQGGCGRVGSACGSSLPTLGDQIGLLPPSAALGVPSHVNALTAAFINRFVIEPQQHVITTPAPVSVDLYVPAPLSILFAKVVVPTVAPSMTNFPNCYFPDDYFLPWSWSSAFTGPAFTNMPTPTVPTWMAGLKAVFQAATLNSAGQVILSTPASVDIQ